MYTAPQVLELSDVPEPELAAGEVIVEVQAVGICGSVELEGFRSESLFRVPPLIMGHEFSGRRLDDGPLAVNPLIACGRCDLCLRGARNICRERVILGIQRSGGFAERAAVPEHACVPLPEGLAPRRAALAEPLANAIHTWRRALAHDQSPTRAGRHRRRDARSGHRACGAPRGIPEVTLSDLSDERLASAGRAGVTSTTWNLEGEYDVLFDAMGTPGTRVAAVERLRPGGAAVWIGLHSPDAGFDGQTLIRNEKQILATFAYFERDFEAAVAMAAALEDFSWVMKRPLDQGVDAFLELLKAPSAATKTMLMPAP